MAKKSEKKCAKCGKLVKTYSYLSYCDSCAEEVWDRGFDSTTQHAEEQYEQALKIQAKIKEYLGHAPITFEGLHKLVSVQNGHFRCKKCGCSRLNWEWFEEDSEEMLKKMVETPCPKCGDSGNFTFK